MPSPRLDAGEALEVMPPEAIGRDGPSVGPTPLGPLGGKSTPSFVGIGCVGLIGRTCAVLSIFGPYIHSRSAFLITDRGVPGANLMIFSSAVPSPKALVYT